MASEKGSDPGLTPFFEELFQSFQASSVLPVGGGTGELERFGNLPEG